MPEKGSSFASYSCCWWSSLACGSGLWTLAVGAFGNSFNGCSLVASMSVIRVVDPLPLNYHIARIICSANTIVRRVDSTPLADNNWFTSISALSALTSLPGVFSEEGRDTIR